MLGRKASNRAKRYQPLHMHQAVKRKTDRAVHATAVCDDVESVHVTQGECLLDQIAHAIERVRPVQLRTATITGKMGNQDPMRRRQRVHKRVQ